MPTTQEPVVTKQLKITISGEAGIFKVQPCKFPLHVIFGLVKSSPSGPPTDPGNHAPPLHFVRSHRWLETTMRACDSDIPDFLHAFLLVLNVMHIYKDPPNSVPLKVESSFMGKTWFPLQACFQDGSYAAVVNSGHACILVYSYHIYA